MLLIYLKINQILNPGGEVVNGDGLHDLNAGPTCSGDAVRSILLYPTQGRINEKWTFDNASGHLLQGKVSHVLFCKSLQNSI